MKRIFAALLLVMLAAPAWGQDFDTGNHAYQRGDYANALRQWQPLADQGLSTAQYALGVMYRNGQGVPQNYIEAVKWYRSAAEQGSAPAQVDLGIIYGVGKIVPRDDIQAHKWLSLAVRSLPAGEARDQVVNLRDISAARMTAAQIAEAQRLAREWKPK